LNPNSKAAVVVAEPLDIATMVRLLERYAAQHEIVWRLSRLQTSLIEQDVDDRFKRTGFDLLLELNAVTTRALANKSASKSSALNAPLLCAALQCSAVLVERLARRAISVAALIDETLVLVQQYLVAGGKTLSREARFAAHSLLAVLFGARRRSPPPKTAAADKAAAKVRMDAVKLLRTELELVVSADRPHVLQTLNRFIATTTNFSLKEVDNITAVKSFDVVQCELYNAWRSHHHTCIITLCSYVLYCLIRI
jgi:hypothetical protein